MKKILLTIIIIMILCSILASCGKDYSLRQDYSAPVFDSNSIIHDVLDIEPENDYSNIVIKTDNTRYSKSVDAINIIVTDQNVGKGFYIYSVPVLQKLEKGIWKTVSISQHDYPCWLFIGEEGNTTKSNYTVIPFATKIIEGGLNEGDYRFIVFTKDRELIVYFGIF